MEIPPSLLKQAQHVATSSTIEEAHAAALNALPANIALLDSNGVIVFVNQAWCRFAIANQLEQKNFCVGENYLHICEQVHGVSVLNATTAAAGIRRVLNAEVDEFVLEYPCHSADEKRWFQLMVTPLHQPQATGAVVMHFNVTKQRQIEEELRHKQAMLSSAVRIAQMGCWNYDISHDKLEWSDEAFRIFGITRENFGGKIGDFFSMIHPDDRENLKVQHDQTITRGGSIQVEYRIQRPDGEERILYDRGETTCNSSGKPIYKCGVVMDITERKRTESSLKASNEHFRKLFEFAPDAMYITDLEGTFVDGNRLTEKLIGYPRGEMIGKNFIELNLLSSADVFKATASLAQNAQGKPAGPIEYLVRTKDFRQVPVEICTLPIMIQNRQLVLGIARDITERRKVEVILRKSEQAFRELAQQLNLEQSRLVAAQRVAKVGSWETDIATLSMTWSEETYRIFEADLRTFKPTYHKLLAFVHPGDRAAVNAAFFKSLEPTMTGEIDHRLTMPDGRVKYISERWEIIYNEQGQPLRASGTCQDITERKLIEEKLREQATILDSAHEAILVKDLNDQILYWNKGAERMYGYTSMEALGCKSIDLFSQNPQQYAAARFEVLASNEWQGEMKKKHKSGRELLVETRWTIVRDEQDTAKAILTISNDITEKRKLETQFFRAQRMEGIGLLVGGVAHDLNNVLSPILTSVEVLKGHVSNEIGRGLLEVLESSAQRGSDLIQQVLSFARGVEGQRISVNLNHILNDIQKIIRDTFPKTIRFQAKSITNLWIVNGDPTHLHQVLTNLCVNARDAMPDGGTLTINMTNVVLDETYASMNSEARPGSFVLITVEDTGTGIPENMREKIFEPFFTTKEIRKGTGLGLSTCLAIVKNHKGFLTLETEIRQGTKILIYLPAMPSGTSESQAPTKELELPRGNGELVLVVEDEEAIRKISKHTLEHFGYRVILATNGAEGISLYAKQMEEIDVVFTDMAMPIMDGAALIAALRAINPNARIIATSGKSSGTGLPNAMLDQANHFMAKPYTAASLLQAIYTVLGKNETPLRQESQGSEDNNTKLL